MSLYKGQSFLLSLDTGIDLSAATLMQILYKKPSFITGFWTAARGGTVLSVTVPAGTINELGVWQFQSYVEIGAAKYWGDIITKNFLQPII